MKFIKAYWKIKNFLEALYQRYNGGSGLLAHKEDKRDKIFGGFLIRSLNSLVLV